MLGGIVVTGVQEGGKNPLNNEDSDHADMNRGVELLLRNKKRRIRKPKLFEVKFSIFNREITLCFDIVKKS